MQFDKYEDINKNQIAEIFKKATLTEFKRGIQYFDLSVSFDTETTSTKINSEKFAFLYFWQFGISEDENPYYCYGRTIQQFISFLDFLISTFGISLEKRLIIYVHNLGFEFQFIRKYFSWSEVFSTDSRTPIKAVTNEGIEFRDSLILSGYKLETLANNLTKHKIKKLVGNLDYTKVRTKRTTLSKEELEYNLNDVRILVAYINEQRDLYGDISKIPLTNTGRVREKLKENMLSSPNDKKKTHKMQRLLTLDRETYLKLKQTFAGGFTHANPNYVGKTLENVASIDFTSSYPTVMLSEKYPISAPKHCFNKKNFFSYANSNKYLSIFEITFTNIIQKVDIPDGYLSKSKCIESKGLIDNNGRVFYADSLTIWLTNVDYNVIKKVYDYDSENISELIYFNKGYLPTSFVKTILDLYKSKTELKGVPGKEQEYLHSKGMLNSLYGNSVMDVIRDQINYNGSWEKVTPKKEEMENQINKYNSNWNRTNYYPWGVFITAYARRNLWSGILSIGNDYVYSDTDSIKFLNPEKHRDYISWYNRDIQDKLVKALNYHKLDTSLYRPKTIKGIEKPLGVWDFEGIYKKFKTLGAKRYLVLTDNDKLEITVAGLPKKYGVQYLLKHSNTNIDKAFQLFNNDLTVPASENNKLTPTYIDEPKSFLIRDYQGHISRETALSSLHLEKTTFTLSLSKQYADFLQNIVGNKILEKVVDTGA